MTDSRPEWSTRFAQERPRVRAAVGDVVVDIEHVGSTAVPGLVATPIVDMLVGVRRLPLGAAAIAALRALGYEDGGAGGLPGRHRFWKGTPEGYALQIVQRESSLWDEPLLLRDYLDAHPDAACDYGALKRRLVATVGQGGRYALRKGFFIARTLEVARVWRRRVEREGVSGPSDRAAGRGAGRRLRQ